MKASITPTARYPAAVWPTTVHDRALSGDQVPPELRVMGESPPRQAFGGHERQREYDRKTEPRNSGSRTICWIAKLDSDTAVL